VVPRYRAPIPGYPDVVLYAEAAVVGNACVGTLTQAQDEGGLPLGTQHARAIMARFDPPEPSAPSAYVGLAYDDAGTLRQGIRMVDPLGVEMLPLDRAARLIDAWRVALWSGRVEVRPAHRPEGTTAVTREQWDQALADLKPKHRRQDELRAALARRLYVSVKTVRGYEKRWSL